MKKTCSAMILIFLMGIGCMASGCAQKCMVGNSPAATPAGAKAQTLDMKTWTWAYTAYADGSRVEPKTAGAFALTFLSTGQVSVKTDCNSMTGAYSAKDRTLTFGNFAGTKMYCDGSQELVFSRMLGEVSSFFFNTRGELVMELKLDSGSMIFK